MPAHELDVAESREKRGKVEESGGGSGVDGERDEGSEGLCQSMGDGVRWVVV